MESYISIVIGVVVAMIYMYNIYLVGKCNLVSRWSVGYFFVILTSPISLFTMIICMMADNYNRSKRIDDNADLTLDYVTQGNRYDQFARANSDTMIERQNNIINMLKSNTDTLNAIRLRKDLVTSTISVTIDNHLAHIADAIRDMQSQLNGCVAYINRVQKYTDIIGNVQYITGYNDAHLDDDSIRVITPNDNIPTTELNVVMTQYENGVSFDPVK